MRNAYWDYVFAVQSVDVAQQSVALAEQLVKDNQTRVEVGTMAPIDVVQAQSQAATQRQNLATAEGTRRTNELALKRLIVSGTQDPNWSATIDPVDRPDFGRQTDRRPGRGAPCARRAHRSRAGRKKNLAGQRRHAEVPAQPDAAAGGPRRSLWLVGQGGTQFITTGSGVNRVGHRNIPGGYGDALSTLFTRNYPDLERRR